MSCVSVISMAEASRRMVFFESFETTQLNKKRAVQDFLAKLVPFMVLSLCAGALSRRSRVLSLLLRPLARRLCTQMAISITRVCPMLSGLSSSPLIGQLRLRQRLPCLRLRVRLGLILMVVVQGLDLDLRLRPTLISRASRLKIGKQIILGCILMMELELTLCLSLARRVSRCPWRVGFCVVALGAAFDAATRF